MDDMPNIILVLFFAFIGSLFGFHFCQYESKKAIEECQKELPRNVHCTIIAVPVDKN